MNEQLFAHVFTGIARKAVPEARTRVLIDMFLRGEIPRDDIPDKTAAAREAFDRVSSWIVAGDDGTSSITMDGRVVAVMTGSGDMVFAPMPHAAASSPHMSVLAAKIGGMRFVLADCTRRSMLRGRVFEQHIPPVGSLMLGAWRAWRASRQPNMTEAEQKWLTFFR